uniref:Gamma-interferon-inducible lysosomal thiol reductase n=1 Tax=Timema genevievae TaxID=629358 RepID=A0A7R9K393_TIMGE|nr:unnamed protein product [Timema genevievae]
MYPHMCGSKVGINLDKITLYTPYTCPGFAPRPLHQRQTGLDKLGAQCAHPPRWLAVTVYYESLCPDSVAFITRQLYPTWRLIGDYIYVKFVPFGKSKSNLLGGFNCQHGPRECEGNAIQSCALSLMGQGSPEQVEFVNCIMGSRQPLLVGEQCSTRSGVSWPIVSMCASSNEGTSLQLEAERQTKTLYPGPSFVPTITYDNVFNQNDQRESQYNFLGVVCRHLTHPKPSACSF